MPQLPESPANRRVVVFTALCSVTRKVFGVRLENIQKDRWIADWAFAINADVAKREGFDKTTIQGTFSLSDKYPGCPHCKQQWIAACSCSALTCAMLGIEIIKCPSCGQTGMLTEELKQIRAGTDR